MEIIPGKEGKANESLNFVIRLNGEATMTNDEFDLLDELYFLQSYQYLKSSLEWEDDKLLMNLSQLLEKGWIRCYAAPENEIFDALPLTEKGKTYYYLATKEGLLTHNTL
ncbi:hypothetical protein CQA01_14100 [Cyclobacterium qasimii]|uniref:Uncharacterized protein n=2 Tax=Cyclobacterium qasimii TaxID=1350429 RepID=A0A512C9I8_9BACT|nr:hypothetical protein CQA01_14100 [Cyclobacterium qasimii]